MYCAPIRPSASSPVVSAAALRMPSVVRSNAAVTTSRNRALLVPNIRKMYAWVISARRAIVSVDAPCSPPLANSSAAPKLAASCPS